MPVTKCHLQSEHYDAFMVPPITQKAGVGGAGTETGSHSLNISFIDWSAVQPFRNQLKLLQDTDIMVTGIGTALFYSAFLPYGSVCVNTGWKDTIFIPK